MPRITDSELRRLTEARCHYYARDIVRVARELLAARALIEVVRKRTTPRSQWTRWSRL